MLSDEIYGEILYDGAEHVSLLGYPSIRDRVILLDGWSKTYAMTGWRLGYGLWPEALFGAAERLAINCHSCVNAAAPIRRDRRTGGPARAGAPNGRRLRRAPRSDRRGAQQPARVSLRAAGRRVLTRSPM